MPDPGRAGQPGRRDRRGRPRGRESPICSTPASRSGRCRLDVDAIGCDVLSATGRKYLRGPRGTGFLYVRRGLLERLRAAVPRPARRRLDAPDALRDPRPDARRFENWETNYAAQDRARRRDRLRAAVGPGRDRRPRHGARRATLREQLCARPTASRVHDQGRERCGIVTFALDGVGAGRRRARLRAHGDQRVVSPADYAASTSPPAVSTSSCARRCTTTTPRTRSTAPRGRSRRSLAAVGRDLDDRAVDQPLDGRAVVGVDLAAAQRGRRAAARPPRATGRRSRRQRGPASPSAPRPRRGASVADEHGVGRLDGSRSDGGERRAASSRVSTFSSASEPLGVADVDEHDAAAASSWSRTSAKNSRVVR